MRFKVGNRTRDRMAVHEKVEKPDPNGNRQQRRAWKKKVRKATK